MRKKAITALLLVLVLLAGCSVTVTYTPAVNTDGTLGEIKWGMTQDEVRDALGKRTATAEAENMTKVPKAKLWGLPVTVEFVFSPYEGAGEQVLRLDRIYVTLPDSFDRAALTDELNAQLGKQERYYYAAETGDVAGELPEESRYWHAEQSLADVLTGTDREAACLALMDTFSIDMGRAETMLGFKYLFKAELGELVSGGETVLVIDGGNTLLAQGYVLCA